MLKFTDAEFEELRDELKKYFLARDEQPKYLDKSYLKAVGTLDMQNHGIRNVSDPEVAQDAVTLAYLQALTWMPMTTKGDLLVHNGSAIIRFPVGTNDQALIADSSQSAGVKWAGLNSIKDVVTVIGSYAVGDLLVYIRAASAVIIQRFEGSNSFSTRGYGTLSVAESSARFTAPYDFTLTSVRVYMDKQGSPVDNAICRLYTDSSNSPGAQIELSATTVAGSSISPAGFFTFTFNSALTGGTKYWIVMDRDGSNSNTNYYYVYRNDKWTDGSVQSIFPNSLAKTSGGTDLTGWGSSDACIRMELKGTIAGGYYKWTGGRTSRLVTPYGIVTAANGSSATVVLAGYASGLSGLTPGTIYKIGNCKVGKVMSATELMVWTRKPFVIVDDTSGNGGLLLIVAGGGSNTADAFFPLGFVAQAYKETSTGLSSTFSFSSCEEAEIYDTVSGGAGGATHTDRFSDEYQQLT